MRFSSISSTAALAAALAMALACTTAAHAQSSYVLTTLKAPSSGRVATSASYLGRSFAIDAADHVVGPASYYAGYYFDTNAPHFRVKYEPHVVRWPAGTGVSVSPTKLLKAPEWTYMDIHVSHDAKKVLVHSSGYAVFDVATLKLGAKLPSLAEPVAVNDSGIVAWNARDGSGTFGTWSATGGTVVFAKQADGWVTLKGINNQGVVVGSAQRATEPLKRAAMWANGQMSVLDFRPDVGSLALAINDRGRVLAKSFLPYCHGGITCDSYNDVQGVLENGVFTPIAAPSGPVPYQIYIQTMNNQGVLGGYALPTPGSDDPSTRRGVLWRDNTLIDVTQMLQSKGVQLPSGAVIANVLAINEKGSMVAAMRTSSTTTLVRLTARP